MAPSIRLLSLTEQVSTAGQVVNTIELGVPGTAAVTLTKRTPDPSGVVLLTARGPGWAASHHTGSKDSALALTRRGVAGGALTLRQAIPAGRWFLVPNPAARWVRRVGHGEGGGADVVSLELDALARRAGASQTFYSGGGLKAGLGVSASSGGGRAYSLCARQKLKRGAAGPLHSIGGAYSSVAGPELTAKFRPGKGVFGRLVFWPHTGVAALSAYASPAWLTRAAGGSEGARKATLTLDARASVVERAGGGKAVKSELGGTRLGLSWRF